MDFAHVLIEDLRGFWQNHPTARRSSLGYGSVPRYPGHLRSSRRAVRVRFGRRARSVCRACSSLNDIRVFRAPLLPPFQRAVGKYLSSPVLILPRRRRCGGAYFSLYYTIYNNKRVVKLAPGTPLPKNDRKNRPRSHASPGPGHKVSGGPKGKSAPN